MINLIRPDRDRNIVSLLYLFLSFLIAAIAGGINVVAFPAILMKHNVEPVLIGLASSNELVFGFIAAIFLAKFVLRFGLLFCCFVTTIVYSSVVFLMYFYQNYALWLIFEAVIGTCWILLYVIRQAWVNSLIADRNRSIILALISSLFCFGFLFGSFLVKFLGALNHYSLIISSILILISGFLLFLVNDTAPKKLDSDHIKCFEFFKKLPDESLARFLLDFQAGCLVCLGVLFGVKVGFTAENSGLLVAAYMASGIFDLYAGILVKHFDIRKMIFYGFLGCLVTISMAMIFYTNYVLLLASFFFFGISCALIFISSITNVNNFYPKEKLVAANATFQAFGSLGAVMGCFVGGLMIQIFGYFGFFLTILFATSCYLSYYLIFSESQYLN